ncbi:LytTR family transcriptional regulator DNA-binding domain-containing protein [Halobacillus massiliensis]|uniref:LytTR family transcriptional regulator DNA-binding domain-containing protein n=1 Tax=Halobacillus massiliensis TaxID=1926286 RepID=UPI0009E5D94C|nr:LytTR family transcriptional regulator DNA-binding domain-containing protein [Halobacillus massiliensis]
MKDYRYVKQVDLRHTGMVYKFTRKQNEFIHTEVEGQLLYNLGFKQTDILGKNLDEFLPYDIANFKKEYYCKAWKGETVHYESENKGIHYFACLRPVFKNGEVVEVVGSCIDVTALSTIEAKQYSVMQQLPEINQMKQSLKSERKKLVIKENSKFIFIPLAEIVFIERVNRKSVIYSYKKHAETYESLTSLNQQLDDSFFRCHKSYILNIDYLEVIEQKNQKYCGHFYDYDKSVKISKDSVQRLKTYKSH